jgi:hypothetical protein
MTSTSYAENAHITYGYFRGLFRDLASVKPGERNAAIMALGLDRKDQPPDAALATDA